jgi:hypothetical protein
MEAVLFAAVALVFSFYIAFYLYVFTRLKKAGAHRLVLAYAILRALPMPLLVCGGILTLAFPVGSAKTAGLAVLIAAGVVIIARFIIGKAWIARRG